MPMPNFTDLTGLAGVAIATAASLQLLPGIVRLTKTHLAILLGALFVLMLIPFNGMPLAAYIRGATGDLSITTLMLLWCTLLRPWCGAIKFNDHNALLLMVALAALALYPMSLGAGAYDPYRLGYSNPQFVATLLLLALAAWFWKATLITLCIGFATLAWAAGWYESDNLWDYLLDPWVAIYALFTITLQGVRVILQRAKTHDAQ